MYPFLLHIDGQGVRDVRCIALLSSLADLWSQRHSFGMTIDVSGSDIARVLRARIDRGKEVPRVCSFAGESDAESKQRVKGIQFW